MDQIYEYYREAGFTDWTHAETGAPALKAQHPEFEMWNQGIHARSGVACADCHMPYMREGAQKISDHHVRSPLLNINRACQTCHKWSEDELRARVETIQQRTVDLRNRAMDALVALIADIKAAKAAGAAGAPLTAALEFQRHGQFYLDFVESENSNGFHAPQEAARILGEAIDYLRQGQLALRPAHAAVPHPPAAVLPRAHEPLNAETTDMQTPEDAPGITEGPRKCRRSAAGAARPRREAAPQIVVSTTLRSIRVACRRGTPRAQVEFSGGCHDVESSCARLRDTGASRLADRRRSARRVVAGLPVGGTRVVAVP